MQINPQAEHQWLEQLVGNWTYEMECVMGPGQEPQKNTGKETVRSFGGLWIIAEGENVSPQGKMLSILTLGYDPQTNHFTGTFIATCMTRLWVYKGNLNEQKTVLTLDTEGPNFTDGKIIPYQDIIEILGKDQRTLTSQSLGPDGKWQHFMKITYRR